MTAVQAAVRLGLPDSGPSRPLPRGRHLPDGDVWPLADLRHWLFRVRLATSGVSFIPSAFTTFSIVPRLGLPSADNALYRPSRVSPVSFARRTIPYARAILPRATAMKA